MKYYKTNWGFGTQPNNIVPPDAIEITEAEYFELQVAHQECLIKIANYVQEIKDGKITLEEIPSEYRIRIEEIINIYEQKESISPYGVTNEQYNSIIDDYTLSLIESGVL